jgi:hypothetical protein
VSVAKSRTHPDTATEQAPVSRANGSATTLPDWITDELVEKTIAVWQPYYSDPLTAEDAAYIILSVGRLFETLSKTAGTTGSTDPRTPGD